MTVKCILHKKNLKCSLAQTTTSNSSSLAEYVSSRELRKREDMLRPPRIPGNIASIRPLSLTWTGRIPRGYPGYGQNTDFELFL